MSNIPTPHNTAKYGEIAKKVLMPGDPLCAKYIAEHYLEDAKCVNTVRNMLAFTGKYKGNEVTIMGGGMGIPSISIYSYELFNFYDVDKIIRIGSAGGLQDDVKLMDVIIAMGACTDSNYASHYGLPGTFAPIADYSLLKSATDAADRLGIPVRVGNVVSSDVFYSDNKTANDAWKKMGALCVEMECAALFMNAARAGKQALGILTISDHLYRPEYMSAEEREKSFNQMMEIALEA